MNSLADSLTALLADTTTEPVKFPASAPDYIFSQSLFKLRDSDKEVVLMILDMGIVIGEGMVDVEFRFSENLLAQVVRKQISDSISQENLELFAKEAHAMLELFTGLDDEE